MVISEVQARQITLHITDPTPADTSKYLVRYKKDTGHAHWVTKEKSKVGQGSDVYMTLNGVHPFTAYVVEVASYYKDQDEGPYSVPKRFTTKQAGMNAVRSCSFFPMFYSMCDLNWDYRTCRVHSDSSEVGALGCLPKL